MLLQSYAGIFDTLAVISAITEDKKGLHFRVVNDPLFFDEYARVNKFLIVWAFPAVVQCGCFNACMCVYTLAFVCVYLRVDSRLYV